MKLQRFVLSLLATLFMLTSVKSQVGVLDPNYYAGHGIGTYSQYVYDVLVLSDGSSMVVGNFSFVHGRSVNGISKLTGSGENDLSFNPGTGANGAIRQIVQQSDGKFIIIGEFTSYNGTTRNRIARINADGSLDTGFNVGTGLNNAAYKVALQSDGKVVVVGLFTAYAGTTVSRVVRINTDGSRDTGFGVGVTNTSLTSIAIQSDGKLLIGGSYNASISGFKRLNTDGTLDNTFNSGGTGFNANVNSIHINSSGRILVAGNFTTYNGVSRVRIVELNMDGTVNTSFVTGSGFNNEVHEIKQRADSRILISGNFTAYNGYTINRIACLDTLGGRDTSFAVGTGFDRACYGIDIQSDGKIIGVGTFRDYNGFARLSVARLSANGTLDQSYFYQSKINGEVYGAASQSHGKTIVVGQFTKYNGTTVGNILRLDTLGNIDSTFMCGTGAAARIRTVLVLPDDKILVGGDFGTFNGQTRTRLALLNSDGSLNTGFTLSLNNVPTRMISNAAGKIYLAGAFTQVGGVGRVRLARLNANLTLDNTFTIGTGFNGGTNDLALQSDGKLIVGGAFTAVNGITLNNIARLDTTGTVDSTFSIGTGFNSQVLAIYLQSDGKILIGGSYTQYNGATKNRIVRLNANGTVDASFVGTANSDVRAIAPLGAGYVFGGAFTTFNSVSKSNLVYINSTGVIDGTNFPAFSSADGLILMAQADPVTARVFLSGQFTNINERPSNSFAALIGGYAATAIDSIDVDTLLCSGATVNITLKKTKLFNSGNIFTVQLSDATGSFTSPVNIGSKNASGTGWDFITVNIPSGTTAGSNYKVRIVSTNAVCTSSESVPINIYQLSAPDVPEPQSICSNVPYTFTFDTIHDASDSIEWALNSGFTNSHTLVGTGSISFDVDSATTDSIWIRNKTVEGCVSSSVVTTATVKSVNKPVLPDMAYTICTDEPYAFEIENILAGAGGDEVQVAENSSFEDFDILTLPGAIEVTLNPGASRTYWLRTKNTVTGCYSDVQVLTVALIQPVGINLSLVDFNCNALVKGAASVSVHNGLAPYTYQWNTSANTSMIENQDAGTYSITVTDANDCTASATGSISCSNSCGIEEASAACDHCDGDSSFYYKIFVEYSGSNNSIISVSSADLADIQINESVVNAGENTFYINIADASSLLTETTIEITVIDAITGDTCIQEVQLNLICDSLAAFYNYNVASNAIVRCLGVAPATTETIYELVYNKLTTHSFETFIKEDNNVDILSFGKGLSSDTILFSLNDTALNSFCFSLSFLSDTTCLAAQDTVCIQIPECSNCGISNLSYSCNSCLVTDGVLFHNWRLDYNYTGDGENSVAYVSSSSAYIYFGLHNAITSGVNAINVVALSPLTSGVDRLKVIVVDTLIHDTCIAYVDVPFECYSVDSLQGNLNPCQGNIIELSVNNIVCNGLNSEGKPTYTYTLNAVNNTDVPTILTPQSCYPCESFNNGDGNPYILQPGSNVITLTIEKEDSLTEEVCTRFMFAGDCGYCEVEVCGVIPNCNYTCSIDSLELLCAKCESDGVELNYWTLQLDLELSPTTILTGVAEKSQVAQVFYDNLQQGENEVLFVAFHDNTVTDPEDVLHVYVIDTLTHDTCTASITVPLSCSEYDIYTTCENNPVTASAATVYCIGNNDGMPEYMVVTTVNNPYSNAIIAGFSNCTNCSDFYDTFDGWFEPGENIDTLYFTMIDSLQDSACLYLSITDAELCADCKVAICVPLVACGEACSIKTADVICMNAVLQQTGDIQYFWSMKLDYVGQDNSVLSAVALNGTEVFFHDNDIDFGSNKILISSILEIDTVVDDTLLITITNPAGDICQKLVPLAPPASVPYLTTCEGLPIDFTPVEVYCSGINEETGRPVYTGIVSITNSSGHNLGVGVLECADCNSEYNGSIVAPGTHNTTVNFVMSDTLIDSVKMVYGIFDEEYCGMCYQEVYLSLPGLADYTPVFTSDYTILCANQEVCFSAVTAVSGTVSYSIVSGGATVNPSTGCVSDVTSDFVIRATSSTCSSVYTDLLVTVVYTVEAPVVTQPADTCSNDSILMGISEIIPGSGTDEVEYSFSSDFTTTYNLDSPYIVSFIVSPNVPLTVWFRGKNSSTDCVSESVSVTLNAYSSPAVTVSPIDTVIDNGDSVQLSAYGADTYLWSLFNNNDQSIVVTPAALNTTYEVVGYDVHGCSASASSNVHWLPQLSYINYKDTIESGDSTNILMLLQQPGQTVTWERSHWINISGPLVGEGQIIQIPLINETGSAKTVIFKVGSEFSGSTVDEVEIPVVVLPQFALEDPKNVDITAECPAPVSACAENEYTIQIDNNEGTTKEFELNIDFGNDAEGIALENSFELTSGFGTVVSSAADGVVTVAIELPASTIPKYLKYNIFVPCDKIPVSSNSTNVVEIETNYTIANSDPVFTYNDPINEVVCPVAFPFLSNSFPMPPAGISEEIIVEESKEIKVAYVNSGTAVFDGYITHSADFGSCADITTSDLVVTVYNSNHIAIGTPFISPAFPLHVIVPVQGTIEITQDVKVENCSLATCQVDFDLNWGCTNDIGNIAGGMCKTNTSILVNISRSTKMPELIITRMKPYADPSPLLNTELYNKYNGTAWDGSCMNSENEPDSEWEFFIYNASDVAVAKNVKIMLDNGDPDAYTYIKESTVQRNGINVSNTFTGFSGPAYLPAVSSSDPAGGPCAENLGDAKNHYVIEGDGGLNDFILNPHEGIIVSFKTYRCCPSDKSYEDAMAEGYLFNRWNLTATCKDLCGTTVNHSTIGDYDPVEEGYADDVQSGLSFNDNGPRITSKLNNFNVQSGAISTNQYDVGADLLLRQAVDMANHHLAGSRPTTENPTGCGESEKFTLENLTFPSQNKNASDFDTQIFTADGNNTTGLFGLTGDAPAGKIRYTFTTTANVHIDDLKVPVIRTNGYDWKPISAGFTGASTYEAEFDIQQNWFATNGTTPIAVPFTTSGGFRALFQYPSKLDFFAKACCPLLNDDAQGVLVNTDFKPGSNACGGSCFIKLSEVEYNVNIHCPGCITPGMIVDKSEFIRTTVGYEDKNDDGLPDAPGNALALINPATYLMPPLPAEQVSPLDLDKSMVGDAIRSRAHAFFEDGDPGRCGFSYAGWSAEHDNEKVRHLYHEQLLAGGNVLGTGFSLTLSSVQLVYTPISGAPPINYTIPTSSCIPSTSGNDIIYLTYVDLTSLTPPIDAAVYDEFEFITDFSVCTNPTASSVPMNIEDYIYFSPLYIDPSANPHPATSGGSNLDILPAHYTNLLDAATPCVPTPPQETCCPIDVDASDIPTNSPYLWICEPHGTSHTVYGVGKKMENDFTNAAEESCDKKITSVIEYYVGEHGVGNVFSYEYRPLFNVSDAATMYLDVPTDYLVEVQRMYTQAPTYGSGIPTYIKSEVEAANILPLSVPPLPGGQLEDFVPGTGVTYTPPYTNQSFMSAISGMNIFPPSPPALQQLNNGTKLVLGDENFTMGIEYILHPTCTATTQNLDKDDLYFVLPDMQACQSATAVVKDNDFTATLTTPAIVISANPISPPVQTGDDMTYEVEISVDNGVVSNAVLYYNPEQLPAGTELISITDAEGNTYAPEPLPIPHTDGDDYAMYNLGHLIGESYFFTFRSIDCSGLNASALVDFELSWNCSNTLPTSLPPATTTCSTPIPFQLNVEMPAYNVSIHHNTVNAMAKCVSTTFTASLVSVETGGVGNVKAIFNIPDELQLVDAVNPFKISLGGVDYACTSGIGVSSATPTTGFTKYTVDLTAITSLTTSQIGTPSCDGGTLTGPGGVNAANSPLEVSFDIMPKCMLNDEEITATPDITFYFDGTKYCGIDENGNNTNCAGCGINDDDNNGLPDDIYSFNSGSPIPVATGTCIEPNLEAHCDGTITIAPESNTIPPASTFMGYVWGTNVPILSGPEDAGLYEVTVTDGNACSVTASVNVYEEIVIPAAAVTNVTCPGGNDGSVSIPNVLGPGNESQRIHGGSGSYSVSWTNSSGQVVSGGLTATGIPAGEYTFTVTDDVTECQKTSTVTVGASLFAVTPNITPTDCSNSNNGILNLNTSGGTPPYNYQWSPATQTYSKCVPGSTSISVSVALSGEVVYNLRSGVTYHYTVTDDNGCIVIGSKKMETRQLGFSINSGHDYICPGASNGQLSASIAPGLGTSFQSIHWKWSNNATGSSISSLSAGAYSTSVTAVYTHGCCSAQKGPMNVIEQLSNITVSTAPESCDGADNGTATVTGFPAGSGINWSDGTATNVPNKILGLGNGPHSVTITYDGCTKVVDFTIGTAEDFTTAIAVHSPQPINGGYCPGLIQLKSPVVGSGTPVYTWSGPGITTTNEHMSMPTGTLVNSSNTTSTTVNYNVSVNLGGCIATDDITVTVHPAPSVTLDVSDGPYCVETPINVSATPAGGQAPYTYTWSNTVTPTTTNPVSSTGNVTNVTTPGGRIITITVKDANNCKVTASEIVNIGAYPVVAGVTKSGNSIVVADGEYCDGQLITLTTAINYVNGTTYEWRNPDNIVIGTTRTINIGTADVNNAAMQGDYTIKVTLPTGCSTTVPVPVSIKPKPIFNLDISDGPYCLNSPITLTTEVISTVPNISGYNWSTGATVGTPASSATYTPTSAGGKSYTVTVIGDNGCNTSGNVSVTVNANPVVVGQTRTIPNAIVANGSYCHGQAIVLTTSINYINGTTYEWRNPENIVIGTTRSINIGTADVNNAAMQGDYTIKVTLPTGCSTTVLVPVSIKPKPIFNLDISDGPYCVNSPITLAAEVTSAVPNISGYNWSTGATVGTPASSATYTPTSTGGKTYAVTVSGDNGCSTSGNVSVTVNAQPAPLATVNGTVNPITLCQGGTFTLSTNSNPSPGNHSYSWSNAPTLPAWTASGRTQTNVYAVATSPYIVTVTNTTTGCLRVSSVNVNVTPKPNISSLGPISAAVTCVSGKAIVTVNSTSLADGTYDVTYNLSGANTATGETAEMVFSSSNDYGTFETIDLINAGNTTVTITNLIFHGQTSCGVTVGANNTALVNVAGTPVVSNFALSTPNGACGGQEVSVLVTSNTLATGTYEVTYTVNGYPQTMPDVPAIMNFTAGSPGTGTFVTNQPIEGGSVTIAVTNIENVSSGCSSPVTASVSVTMDILAPPTLLIYPGTSVCYGSEYLLVASLPFGNVNTTFEWYIGGALVSTEQNPILVNNFTTPTSTNVVLNVINGCGTNSVEQPIEYVSSSITANAGVDAVLCGNDGSYTISGASATGSSPYWQVIFGGDLEGVNHGLSGSSTFTPTFTFSDNYSGTTVLQLASNDYTITVDPYGCMAADYMQITVNPSPDITAQTTASCIDVPANGAVNVSVSGSPSPYVYAWSNSAATQDITNVVAGNYTVSVTDDNNCSASETFTVPGVVFGYGVITNVSCNGTSGNNGAISLYTFGGAAPHTYSWTGPSSYTSTMQNISPLQDGAYSVTVTDANGCATIMSFVVEVDVPITGLTASVTGGNSVCDGEVVQFNASASGTGITWSWNGPLMFNPNTANPTVVAAPNRAGTYYVNAYNSCGAVSDNIQLSVDQYLIVDVTGNTSGDFCEGSDIYLRAVLYPNAIDVTYNWHEYNSSTVLSATNELFLNDVSGLIDALVVDVQNSCGTFVSPPSAVTIDPPASSPVDAGNDLLTCTHENGVTINGSYAGGSTYVWQILSGEGTLLNTNTLTPFYINPTLAHAVISLSAFDDTHGCFTTQVVQVDVVESPTFTLEDITPSCNGYISNGAISLGVTGGTLPYSYAWSNAGTFEDLGGLAAGDYTLTVTDANGCTPTVTYTVPGVVTIAASVTDVSCSGTNDGSIDITVGAGQAPYTYSWSPNSEPTEDIGTLIAGTYTVTVIESGVNSCSSSATIVVEQNIPITSLSITPSANPICNFSDLALSTTVAPTTANDISWTWSGPNSFSSSLQNPTIASIEASGVGIYTVTATNLCGAVTQTVSIGVDEPIMSLFARPLGTGNVCEGSDVYLTAQAYPATVSVNWLWTDPSDQPLANSQEFTLTNVDASDVGEYTIFASNGCGTQEAYANIFSVQSSTATANAGSDDQVCASTGSYTISGASVSGDLHFVWSTSGTGVLLNKYTLTPTYQFGPNETGSVVLELQVNGSMMSGCHTSSLMVLDILPSPVVSSNVTIACNTPAGGAADITVSSGISPYSYAWSNSAATEDLSNVSSGTYIVTVSSGNSCSTTATVVIPQTMQIASTVKNVSCGTPTNNGNINIAVTGGTAPYTYLWSNSAATAFIAGLVPNTYSVTVTDAAGCQAFAAIPVFQDLPITGLNASVSQAQVCEGSTITLSATPANNDITWHWSGPNGYNATTASATRIITSQASGEGVYTVSATNSCSTVTDNVNVVVDRDFNGLTFNTDYPQICEGSDYTLEANLNYLTDVDFMWTRTNDNTPVCSTSVYTINDISATDGGEYLISVSNACRTEVYSHYIWVGTALTLAPDYDPITQDPGTAPCVSTGTYTISGASITPSSTGVMWYTSGTGTLSDETTLAPTYTYGVGETGSVILSMVADAGSCSLVNTLELNLVTCKTDETGLGGTEDVGDNGIESSNKYGLLRIYPNPNNGNTISVEYAFDFTCDVIKGQVMDSKGALARSFNIENIGKKTGVEKIDLQNLQPGIYVVKIECGGEFIKEKIVVMK